MKTILALSTLFAISLLTEVSFASKVQFEKIRSQFTQAEAMSKDDLIGLTGKDIMCVTLHEDGTSDIVEKAIVIDSKLRNRGADARWAFGFKTVDGILMGVVAPSDKYQPVPFYKAFRKLKDRVIVEWSNKPYSIYVGMPGYTYVNYGYSSAKSISMPDLISSAYSYCK